MPKVAAAFFGVGILCVLGGMLWGMDMGASNNMTMMPAHAHLNLVGWATMALYGTFYALTGETLSPKLAWTNFVISTLGILILIPSLAVLLANGQDPKFEPPVIVGSVITFIGAIVFAIAVGRELMRPRTA